MAPNDPVCSSTPSSYFITPCMLIIFTTNEESQEQITTWASSFNNFKRAQPVSLQTTTLLSVTHSKTHTYCLYLLLAYTAICRAHPDLTRQPDRQPDQPPHEADFDLMKDWLKFTWVII
ncbi:hypothetical protein AVEN_29989-1 [Araneus ventricosus]|uniref:Uncharacterized protein n=1 Tax=Araneus ventricosus TaxID=182803 RepID=A0A4Y2K750_ARAVE|nr:hypothetical protein AVEN_29989-1 [Araneus ventricosus]